MQRSHPTHLFETLVFISRIPFFYGIIAANAYLQYGLSLDALYKHTPPFLLSFIYKRRTPIRVIRVIWFCIWYLLLMLIRLYLKPNKTNHLAQIWFCIGYRLILLIFHIMICNHQNFNLSILGGWKENRFLFRQNPC